MARKGTGDAPVARRSGVSVKSGGTSAGARTAAVLRDLLAESARTDVIVGASILDSRLRALLQKSMIRGVKTDAYFEGPAAPFGTFSARIKACYYFGLISRDIYSDLELIRKIRNKFAHSLTRSMGFDEPNVKGWTDGLRTPLVAPKDTSKSSPLPKRRRNFTFATSVILGYLDGRLRDTPSAKRVPSYIDPRADEA